MTVRILRARPGFCPRGERYRLDVDTALKQRKSVIPNSNAMTRVGDCRQHAYLEKMSIFFGSMSFRGLLGTT